MDLARKNSSFLETCLIAPLTLSLSLSLPPSLHPLTLSLSVCLSPCLVDFLCLCVCHFVRLSFVAVCLYFSLTHCLPVCLPVSLSLSICLSVSGNPQPCTSPVLFSVHVISIKWINKVILYLVNSWCLTYADVFSVGDTPFQASLKATPLAAGYQHLPRVQLYRYADTKADAAQESEGQ